MTSGASTMHRPFSPLGAGGSVMLIGLASSALSDFATTSYFRYVVLGILFLKTNDVINRVYVRVDL